MMVAAVISARVWSRGEDEVRNNFLKREGKKYESGLQGQPAMANLLTVVVEWQLHSLVTTG